MGRVRVVAAGWTSRAVSAVTCALFLSTVGCGGGGSPATDETQTVQSALDPSVTVSVGQASYAVGAVVTVSYAGLPGNADDWIALAPAGSPSTTYHAYVFTGGQTSGTASIVAPAAGTYVARAFPHNTFNLLAETAPFQLTSATLNTDQSSYAPGAAITVTYTGMPGYANDWIALAPVGSPNTTYRAYFFTNGQTSGTLSFTAPLTPGGYVIRGFPRNTYTLLAQSATFVVGSASATPMVGADQASYASGQTITVNYAGLPGNAQDMIVLTTLGAANTSYVASVFTNGQTSGTATFTAPVTSGAMYVARAFPNSTFDLLAESQPFMILSGTSVAVGQSSYAAGATVTVTYAGLPGYADDWIALASAGAANTSYVAYVFTGGQTSGTASFTAPAAGTYTARAFSHNTFTRLAESASFTVTGATIHTDLSSYAPGATITVTYAGLPGFANDWIALAPAGSSSKTYLAYVFTNGQTSGTASFTAPAVGSYVARAFPHNTFNLLAESAFAVAASLPVSCPTVPALAEITGQDGTSRANVIDIGDTHVLMQDDAGYFFFDIGTSTKTPIVGSTSPPSLTAMAPGIALALGSASNGLAGRAVACEVGWCWDLGGLSATAGSLAADSNGVEIVGTADTDSGENHPFKVAKYGGSVIDLGTLGGPSAEGKAINGSGAVVGWSTRTDGAIHAYLWSAGVMSDLGTLGGTYSSANAINVNGQVVGEAETATGETHAFLWDGTMHDLGTLGGTRSSASAINASGQVIGTATTASGETHAFIWSAGVMTDLGTLGGSESQPYGRHALNDAGQVVGYTTNAAGDYRGFVWQLGVMRDLGTLGGTSSLASGINAGGAVVGASTVTTDGNIHSFVVVPGTCTKS